MLTAAVIAASALSGPVGSALPPSRIAVRMQSSKLAERPLATPLPLWDATPLPRADLNLAAEPFAAYELPLAAKHTHWVVGSLLYEVCDEEYRDELLANAHDWEYGDELDSFSLSFEDIDMK
ncbi:hypothetical protein T492DRAFT_1109923 [Pavlovales sp. CCMP2436]|nr:hypothetical protein T492DRAFT_1109923 [Pavlovales sp. CCMP2436]